MEEKLVVAATDYQNGVPRLLQVEIQIVTKTSFVHDPLVVGLSWSSSSLSSPFAVADVRRYVRTYHPRPERGYRHCRDSRVVVAFFVSFQILPVCLFQARTAAQTCLLLSRHYASQFPARHDLMQSSDGCSTHTHERAERRHRLHPPILPLMLTPEPRPATRCHV